MTTKTLLSRWMTTFSWTSGGIFACMMKFGVISGWMKIQNVKAIWLADTIDFIIWLDDNQDVIFWLFWIITYRLSSDWMKTFSFTLLWWVVLWWLSYDGHLVIGALGWLSSDKLFCGDWPLVVVTWWLSGGGCLGFLWWLSCHGFPFLPASKLLSCHFCPAIASLPECMVYFEIDKGTKPYFFLYIVKILIRALYYCNKISKYFIPTYQSDSS